MNDIESIEVYGKKYKIILDNRNNTLTALRYGEKWRDLTGDNLIMSMFSEIQEYKESKDKYESDTSEGKRVYVLEYKIHVNLYSLGEPNIETRTVYYSREERDQFIDKYLDMMDPKKKHYIQDVKAYFAELRQIDMRPIINAI